MFFFYCKQLFFFLSIYLTDPNKDITATDPAKQSRILSVLDPQHCPRPYRIGTYLKLLKIFSVGAVRKGNAKTTWTTYSNQQTSEFSL